ncbi:glutathione S-transferase family protein [Methylovirgula sp. 4M-Z18]|uniref:glutathione S-transferase family protein n=1 Tax=Methylovirgula sp. 4M-Z18 TaxID=2293567 RepID=UPI000E2ECD95|nr:glutathione S-transferase family protein [Methylovirgula sp. 4M-Z18]RFB80818.1 glutathione S-transferase family protein [Methylovirgula sp. 4M-Z18]
MLTIWGRLNSINVQKVLFCAEELGLAYKRIDAGRGFGVNDTDEYLAMNPNGLIPVINDGGFVLWESNAIVRYLCAKHSDGMLWPHDLRTRAEADRWMDWQTTTLGPAMDAAFKGSVRTPPGQRDAAAIEASCASTEALISILDAHLQRQKWLVGNAFSMAEIAVGAAVHRWLNMPVERKRRPYVVEWYHTVMQHLGARKILALPVT